MRKNVCLALVVSALAALLLIGCSGGDLAQLLGGGGQGVTTRQIALADVSNERVLVYNYPAGTDANAAIVLGQTDFASTASGADASSFYIPMSVAFDASGNLWVADMGNNRLLRFDAPLTNGKAASLVLGQPDFTTTVEGLTQKQLAVPDAVALDPSGNVWVVDSFNQRVLEFKPPFTNGKSASVVLGQPDFTSTGCGATSATTLCHPQLGLAIDAAGNVWVSDTYHWRILEYKPPYSNGMAASVVIGQPDMATAGPQLSATGDSGFGGLRFDASGNLWAADSFNNRVLEYKPPFSNGMAAAIAIGQPNLTSNPTGSTAAGVDLPLNSAFDSSGNLYVSDTSNNRVLVFAPPFSSGMSATKVLGQPDFTSTNSNQGGAAAANTLDGPNGMATR